MSGKHDRLARGLKAAYHGYKLAEAVHELAQVRPDQLREILHQIKEIALFLLALLALAVLYGGVWLLTQGR
jgi:hypothetical protein